jgi:hypothetical protein
MVCENTTRFLNVDLDLRAKRDLSELVAAFALEASTARFAQAPAASRRAQAGGSCERLTCYLHGPCC